MKKYVVKIDGGSLPSYLSGTYEKSRDLRFIQKFSKISASGLVAHTRSAFPCHDVTVVTFDSAVKDICG